MIRMNKFYIFLFLTVTRIQTTPLEEQTHTRKGGARGVVREYCETCEIFGHDTDDCNDGETF